MCVCVFVCILLVTYIATLCNNKIIICSIDYKCSKHECCYILWNMQHILHLV